MWLVICARLGWGHAPGRRRTSAGHRGCRQASTVSCACSAAVLAAVFVHAAGGIPCCVCGAGSRWEGAATWTRVGSAAVSAVVLALLPRRLSLWRAVMGWQLVMGRGCAASKCPASSPGGARAGGQWAGWTAELGAAHATLDWPTGASARQTPRCMQ